MEIEDEHIQATSIMQAASALWNIHVPFDGDPVPLQDEDTFEWEEEEYPDFVFVLEEARPAQPVPASGIKVFVFDLIGTVFVSIGP